MKPHALIGVLAALTVGAASTAHAGNEVESVSLAYNGGITVHVNLGITNGATTANTAVVGPLNNSMSLAMTGHVKCERDKNVAFTGSNIYFGSAYVFVDQVVTTNVVYTASFNPSFTTWGGTFKGWTTEAGDNQPFVVPLNAIKNGPPLVRFDPVEEFNKRMQTHINNGGTKLDFLQHDHLFQVQRAVSMVGTCHRTKGQPSAEAQVAQTTVNLNVKYTGNPNLSNINPQISQALPQNGGFKAGYNPLALSGGELIAFQPNYVGKCPAEPKFRVKMTGGGTGEVKVRINQGGTTIHNSPAIAFANGEAIYEFTFPVPYEGKNSLNKKVSHDFRLYAKAKDEKEDYFPSHWQYYDQLTWNHTCTPTLNVIMGGQGGIKAKDEEGASQMQLKVQPVNPDPTPTPTLKVAPQQTKPRRALPTD